MAEYEAVIGLEVHAQLKTRSKIFCGCSTEFGGEPNSRTCPVCLGHPGALPVLNAAAVELAVRAALALGCSVSARSTFARKNYFYPDLPKGYQISQYEDPLATGGGVVIETGEGPLRIGLERFHLEEDAGKSVHDGMPDSDRASYVDLNRAGVPLVEIVSKPDLRAAGHAALFLERLRTTFRYLEVCDGNMEEGSLRCDANVSLRLAGEEALGTRTELKNLNSFRNLERALEHEIERQKAVLDSGGRVAQQTVLWDASAGKTRPMRGKEEAEDYRYFPEPDLPPLVLEAEEIERIRLAIPELPAERKQRFVARYALSADDAHQLTLDRGTADYFEEVARLSGNPRSAAAFVLNDLWRELKASRRDSSDVPLPAAHLAALVGLVDSGALSHSAARGLFGELYRTGVPPGELVDSRGLSQLSDETLLRDLVRRVVEAHPEHVERYRAGKSGLFGFLVGEIMKASGGRANPGTVGDLLREILG